MNVPRAARTALLLLLLAALLAPSARADDDPWLLVDRVRAGLEEASPLVADFTQLYLPAGFSTGESESGRVALDLPRCLKWEYEEPFERAYLLCGDVIWTWNEGEESGRRQRVAEEDQPGLDLLRLRVPALRERYRASLGKTSGPEVEIVLTPLAAGELRDATLTVDPASRRVTALAYHDAEGNLTRFDFALYRELPGSDPFSPPAGIDWLDR